MAYKSLLFTLFALMMIPLPSHAIFVDLNMLYFNDSFKVTNTSTVSRTMYDLGVGLPASRTANIFIGLSYAGGSFKDSDGSTTKTYSYTDLGLKIDYFFTKQKTWFTSLSYNLKSTAKYNDGTTDLELRGTSIKVDLGYAFWINDVFCILPKLFYYAPAYTESVTGGTLTKISYSRTLIYPSVGLMLSY